MYQSDHIPRYGRGYAQVNHNGLQLGLCRFYERRTSRCGVWPHKVAPHSTYSVPRSRAAAVGLSPRQPTTVHSGTEQVGGGAGARWRWHLRTAAGRKPGRRCGRRNKPRGNAPRRPDRRPGLFFRPRLGPAMMSPVHTSAGGWRVQLRPVHLYPGSVPTCYRCR